LGVSISRTTDVPRIKLGEGNARDLIVPERELQLPQALVTVPLTPKLPSEFALP
jgi:hypothetical protein